MNSFPYFDSNLEGIDLTLAICQGLRHDIDKAPIPQLLRDLIKKCWDADPEKRLRARELSKIINNWEYDDWLGIDSENWEYKRQQRKKNQFYQQFKALEKKYEIFSQNTLYQIHSNTICTSKLINTKQISQLLQQKTGHYGTRDLELDINNFNLEDPQEQSSLQTQIQIPPKK